MEYLYSARRTYSCCQRSRAVLLFMKHVSCQDAMLSGFWKLVDGPLPSAGRCVKLWLRSSILPTTGLVSIAANEETNAVIELLIG
jgi:hypothetical protein